MSQADVLGGEPAYVLDSSALLALLNRESGANVVRPLVERSVISSVNCAEVFQRAIALGMEVRDLRVRMESLGLGLLPFTAEDAELTAQLWSTTRRAGLSLGDRACLSLARRLGMPALTADRGWASVDLEVEVRLIRRGNLPSAARPFKRRSQDQKFGASDLPGSVKEESCAITPCQRLETVGRTEVQAKVIGET